MLGTKRRRLAAFIFCGLVFLSLFITNSPHRANSMGVLIAAGNRKALVMLPIFHENNKSWSPLIEDLKGAGYEVTVKVDNEVNLELLKNLSDYSVIFINTHGTDPDHWGDYYFVSGLKYTPDVKEEYYQDFDQNLLKDGKYVMVSPSYIRKYNYDNGTGERFDDALLYFRSCWSMSRGRLTKALSGTGVQVLIGYNRTAWVLPGENYSHFDDVTTVEFFDRACGLYMSTDYAFKQVYDSYPAAVGLDSNTNRPIMEGPPCIGWVLDASYDPEAYSYYLNWVEKEEPTAMPEEKQRPEKPVMVKLYSEVNSSNYILIYEDNTVSAVYNVTSYTGTYWTDDNGFSYIKLSDGTRLERGPSGWSCFVWNGETMIYDDLLQRQELQEELQR